MPPKKPTTSVKNIHGTSQEKYIISNLSKKYEQAGGTSSNKCQVAGCTNDATATAHVQKAHGNASNDWILTKTCAKHNSAHNEKTMKVNASSLVKVKDINK